MAIENEVPLIVNLVSHTPDVDSEVANSRPMERNLQNFGIMKRWPSVELTEQSL